MAQVSYIREVEEFIEYAAENGIKARERSLWYALMHVMNRRARGAEWPDGFVPITNDRLTYLMGIKNQKADPLIEARKILKDMGRIDFIPGNRNKEAARYKVIFFFAESGHVVPEKRNNIGVNSGNNIGVNSGNNIGVNSGNNIGVNSGNIYKDLYMDRDIDCDMDVVVAGSDETARSGNDNDDANRLLLAQRKVLDAAEKAGFPGDSTTTDKLRCLTAEHGKDAVLSAIDIANERGKPNVGYIKGVLNRDGGKRLDQPKADVPAGKAGKTVREQQYHQREYPEDNSLPDWMQERIAALSS